MPTHKTFEKVAQYYDFAKKVVFGNAIDESQAYFLTDCPHGATHLVIGGGSGLLVQRILERSAPAQIIMIDRSPKMKELTEQRLYGLENREKCTVLEQDVFTWNHSLRFDVIHLPFVVDLFAKKDLELLLAKIDEWLLPAGQLFVSDFNPNKTKMKWLYALYNRIDLTGNSEMPKFLESLAKYNFIPLEVKYFKSEKIISLNMSRTAY